MAKGKKRAQARPDGAEPFNNPFVSSLRALRRTVRDRVTPAVGSRREARVRQSTQKELPCLDDRAQFLDAVSDAMPLETSQRRVKRSRARKDVPSQSPRDEIDFAADEHFDVRYSDYFIRASATGVSRETVARLERGEFAVRSHVDLHGMALDDARSVVDQFLADRQRQGERCVLVITGKGRNSRQQVGVLREKIPEWLARGPSARRVLAFVTARPCDGGEGALYVLLRKGSSSKARIDVIAGGGA